MHMYTYTIAKGTYLYIEREGVEKRKPKHAKRSGGGGDGGPNSLSARPTRKSLLTILSDK